MLYCRMRMTDGRVWSAARQPNRTRGLKSSPRAPISTVCLTRVSMRKETGVVRCGLWIAILCVLSSLSGAFAAEEASSVRPALVDYFPPSEDQGGWRSLLPDRHEPVDAEKTRIREVAGVDWDKLREARRPTG